MFLKKSSEGEEFVSETQHRKQHIISPCNSRHEIEILEKLNKILERLNKEDEDFRQTDINKEIAENGKRDRHTKEEMNYDYMSTAIKNVNEKYKQNSIRSKVSPISKIPINFPKKT